MARLRLADVVAVVVAVMVAATPVVAAAGPIDWVKGKLRSTAREAFPKASFIERNIEALLVAGVAVAAVVVLLLVARRGHQRACPGCGRMNREHAMKCGLCGRELLKVV